MSQSLANTEHVVAQDDSTASEPAQNQVPLLKCPLNSQSLSSTQPSQCYTDDSISGSAIQSQRSRLSQNGQALIVPMQPSGVSCSSAQAAKSVKHTLQSVAAKPRNEPTLQGSVPIQLSQKNRMSNKNTKQSGGITIFQNSRQNQKGTSEVVEVESSSSLSQQMQDTSLNKRQLHQDGGRTTTTNQEVDNDSTNDNGSKTCGLENSAVFVESQPTCSSVSSSLKQRVCVFL